MQCNDFSQSILDELTEPSPLAPPGLPPPSTASIPLSPPPSDQSAAPAAPAYIPLSISAESYFRSSDAVAAGSDRVAVKAEAGGVSGGVNTGAAATAGAGAVKGEPKLRVTYAGSGLRRLDDIVASAVCVPDPSVMQPSLKAMQDVLATAPTRSVLRWCGWLCE